MKKLSIILSLVLLCILSCNKDNERSYDYWSKLVGEKYKEINTLTQSVPCSNIDDFELVNKNGYYLVHPSIQSDFDRLMYELDRFNEEMNRAAGREGIMADLVEPYPPVRKGCFNGKPRLVYAHDLSLDEVNEEMLIRYPEIQNFYNDVPCTDPSAWFSQFMRAGCCSEVVAVHNTIRTDEFLEMVYTYSALARQKISLDNTACTNRCPNMAKPLVCVDGKPFVELVSQ